MTDLQFYSLLAVSALAFLFALAAFLRKPRQNDPQLQQLRREMLEELRATRTELGDQLTARCKTIRRCSLPRSNRLQVYRIAVCRGLMSVLKHFRCKQSLSWTAYAARWRPAWPRCRRITTTSWTRCARRWMKNCKNIRGQAGKKLWAGERTAGAGVQGPWGNADAGNWRRGLKKCCPMSKRAAFWAKFSLALFCRRF